MSGSRVMRNLWYRMALGVGTAAIVYWASGVMLHAQQRQISPGQEPLQCWEVAGTPGRTMQCTNGFWQVQQPDGSFVTGTGGMPAEFLSEQAPNVGPPAAAMFAPNFLFGGGAAATPPSGR